MREATATATVQGVTFTGLGDGCVYTTATVPEMADLLTRLGYPRDAARLLAAQARRDRRKEKRRG